MTRRPARSRFAARLLRPKKPKDASWAFVVLPTEASETLPRRGRTTVRGTLDGHAFTARLEPDGRKGHWLRIDGELLEAAGAVVGRNARFEMEPVECEPDPDVPADFLDALEAAPEARATWDATTTVARVDWIHWITSAKRSTTRAKRIDDACGMLASGKRRVCCFDPSGFYSKAFSAPEAAE